MKTKVIKSLSAGVKIASFITSLAAYQHFIPQAYVPVAVLVFMAASGLKDFLLRAGDLADDGVENRSFQFNPLAFLAALLFTLAMVFGFSSCTVTTSPDGTTVKAVDEVAVDKGASLVERFWALFKADSVTVVETGK